MDNNKSFQKFLLLWAGELISAIGSGLTSFGLGVYVLQSTGRASAMTLVMLLAFLPSILLAPAAGVLADRYDRRMLMIVGDSLSAIGLFYILVCMLRGQAQLWQICVGVAVSSVFASLLEPAYRATVTDLLTKEQFTRASALVQTAGSAKYLISPVLAGILLKFSDIRLLLLIDICTFFVTVSATFVVRRGLCAKPSEKREPFLASFREGWAMLTKNQGILILVLATSLMEFCLGFIQTLSTPMILAYSDSATLGTAETLCAMGMLVTGLFLGIKPLKGHYVKTLCASLAAAGLFMLLFGLRENIVLCCAGGFLFFAMLPFANTSLDYLVRTNLDNAVQGRAWGLIGVISQLGCVLAYALSGLLADYVFTPLLSQGGALSDSVGRIIGVGSGRGAAFLVMLAGLLLTAAALLLYKIKRVRALEHGEKVCTGE